MRILPFVMFVVITSTLAGGLIGGSEHSSADGLAAGLLTCVLVSAGTALVLALTKNHRVQDVRLVIRAVVILNAAALVASLILIFVTGEGARSAGLAGAAASVIILLFFGRRLTGSGEDF